MQAILERTVPELEELQIKGILNADEVKAVVAKRRDLEYALCRRAPSSDDYVRAIEYELSLDAMRRRRKAALGLKRAGSSDHACVRRIHFIFDRACRKFPSAVSWWLQWVDFALRTKSSKSVDRIFGRALMLHPRCEKLWLLAAEWHFDAMNHYATGRALLTRALRINKHSQPLWLAFFRLECIYVLRMRGRRLALGLEKLPALQPPSSSSSSISAAAEGGVLSASAQAQVAVMAQGQEAEKITRKTRAGGSSSGMVPVGGGFEDSEEGDSDNDDEDDEVQEDEEDGSEAVGDGQGAAAAAASAGTVDDSTAAIGGESNGIIDTMPSDAKEAFFAGSVPRIIHDQAVALFPGDVGFRHKLLAVADGFRDVVGAAAAAAAASSSIDAVASLTTSSGPAFPSLCQHIISRLAADHPSHHATWAALAERPLVQSGLEAVLDDRAQRRTVEKEGAAATSSSAAAAASAAAVAEMASDELFMIDAGPAKGTEEGEPADGAAKDAAVASSSPAAKPQQRKKAEKGEPEPFTLPTTLSGLLTSLASGAFDAYWLSGQASKANAFEVSWPGLPRPEGADAEDDESDAFILPLPQLDQPLWTVGNPSTSSASSAASASGGSSSSKKRKRSASSSSAAEVASPEAPSTALPLLLPSPVDPLPAADVSLAEWAGTVTASTAEVLTSAWEAMGLDPAQLKLILSGSIGSDSAATSATSASVGTVTNAEADGRLRLLSSTAALLLRLLALPLADSFAEAHRRRTLLQALAAVGQAAADVIVALPPGATSPKAYDQQAPLPRVICSLVLLHSSVLLRLGQVQAALGVLGVASSSLRLASFAPSACACVSLAQARLLGLLQVVAAPSSDVASHIIASGSSGGREDVPRRPSGLTIDASAQLLPALSASGANNSCVTLLRRSLTLTAAPVSASSSSSSLASSSSSPSALAVTVPGVTLVPGPCHLWIGLLQAEAAAAVSSGNAESALTAVLKRLTSVLKEAHLPGVFTGSGGGGKPLLAQLTSQQSNTLRHAFLDACYAAWGRYVATITKGKKAAASLPSASAFAAFSTAVSFAVSAGAGTDVWIRLLSEEQKRCGIATSNGSSQKDAQKKAKPSGAASLLLAAPATAASSAPSSSSAAASSDVTRLRTLFEQALTSPANASSPQLWAAYVAFARASGGATGSGAAAVSAIHSRAVRSLPPADTAAFLAL